VPTAKGGHAGGRWLSEMVMPVKTLLGTEIVHNLPIRLVIYYTILYYTILYYTILYMSAKSFHALQFQRSAHACHVMIRKQLKFEMKGRSQAPCRPLPLPPPGCSKEVSCYGTKAHGDVGARMLLLPYHTDTCDSATCLTYVD
jgi:hypothetical protein